MFLTVGIGYRELMNDKKYSLYWWESEEDLTATVCR